MEHSEKYEQVKSWYRMALWSLERVKNAVRMGWITEEEYQEITGEKYAEGLA